MAAGPVRAAAGAVIARAGRRGRRGFAPRPKRPRAGVLGVWVPALRLASGVVLAARSPRSATGGAVIARAGSEDGRHKGERDESSAGHDHRTGHGKKQ